MVIVAGAPYYDLVKEREGAPLFFPRCSCPFLFILPSFFLAVLNNGYKIERIVPLHPFSKEISKLKYLLDVLTFYRLTFGQPRQEELVEAIMKEGMDEEEINKLISNLVINLSPIAKKMIEADGISAGHSPSIKDG